MLIWVALFVGALLANTLSAFAGGGAGLVQFPLLIFLGLPFSVALATHKIATVALGIGATVKHYKHGSFDKWIMLLMVITGLPGVFIGAVTILSIPDDIARFALGVMTIALGLYSITKKSLGQTEEKRHRNTVGYAVGGIVLFAIGFLNGSLASGTGLFVTLWLVSWFGLDYKSAVAHTLINVGLLWNGTGAVVLGVLGSVQWSWLPVLLVASLIGGYLGAHLSILKGNMWIKRSYEIITITIGLALLY